MRQPVKAALRTAFQASHLSVGKMKLKKISLNSILAALLNSLFGSSDYPQSVVGKEDGFIDIDFIIDRIEKLENGVVRFYVKGMLRNKKTSFGIELSPAADVSLQGRTGRMFF